MRLYFLVFYALIVITLTLLGIYFLGRKNSFPWNRKRFIILWSLTVFFFLYSDFVTGKLLLLKGFEEAVPISKFLYDSFMTFGLYIKTMVLSVIFLYYKLKNPGKVFADHLLVGFFVMGVLDAFNNFFYHVHV